jgi:subtilisin family serine protease
VTFRPFKRIVFTFLLLVCFSSQVFGAVPVIVQLTPLTNVNLVAQLLGGSVLDSVPGVNVHLLSLPSLPVLSGLQLSLLGITSIELDKVVSVGFSPRAGVLTAPGSAAADLYRYQPAMLWVDSENARNYSTGRGIVVADLNARVDYGHPALAGHLTAGFDFVESRSAYSGTLNQSSSSFLDQSSSSFLDQSSSSFLDQSSSSFLDEGSALQLDSGNPALSHGTFCAGIIAAIAPEAAVMPLRVFDDSGSADIYSITKAIYHATRNGAKVINMSFGVDGSYKVLQAAIAHAQNGSVTIVASAGNANTSVPQYPAAYSNVIAVGATDSADRKASFSNYGSWLTVDAPGVNIISAFPGGYYAMASGTSFSAPMVAAEAALIRSVKTGSVKSIIIGSSVPIDNLNPDYQGKLGAGRINLWFAVR